MPSLLRKLFHKTEAPNDGLTQPQREAIVDLLNHCMYTDNLVMLAEDRLIADTVAKFNWDPKSYRLISSMRDRLVTHGTREKVRDTEINSWLR